MGVGSNQYITIEVRFGDVRGYAKRKDRAGGASRQTANRGWNIGSSRANRRILHRHILPALKRSRIFELRKLAHIRSDQHDGPAEEAISRFAIGCGARRSLQETFDKVDSGERSIDPSNLNAKRHLCERRPLPAKSDVD